jgi:hypothetical protein
MHTVDHWKGRAILQNFNAEVIENISIKINSYQHDPKFHAIIIFKMLVSKNDK